MPADPWAAIAAAHVEIHRIHVLFQLIAAALWTIAAGLTGGVIIAAVVANYGADRPEMLISVLLIALGSTVLATITLASAEEMEEESRERLASLVRPDTRA